MRARHPQNEHRLNHPVPSNSAPRENPDLHSARHCLPHSRTITGFRRAEWEHCPRWQFVLDAMCKKSLQNATTVDSVLMTERMREDLFAEFMGPAFVELPIPASAPLDTDDTMARRLNWVSHPEFVEWYQRQEGRTPRERLSGIALPQPGTKGGSASADIPWLLKWIDGDPA
jgi:hypothetical protein